MEKVTNICVIITPFIHQVYVRDNSWSWSRRYTCCSDN